MPGGQSVLVWQGIDLSEQADMQSKIAYDACRESLDTPYSADYGVLWP